MSKLLLTILSFGILSWFSSAELPFTNKTAKKIDKLVKRTWEGEQISYAYLNSKKDNFSVADSNFFIVNIDDKLEGYLQYRYANGCVKGGCSEALDVASTTEELLWQSQYDSTSYETFEYVILYDEELIVRQVGIVEYNSPHGFEIASRQWLKQFKMYQGNALEFGKDIDGISGATISAKSITKDIEYAYNEMCTFLCH